MGLILLVAKALLVRTVGRAIEDALNHIILYCPCIIHRCIQAQWALLFMQYNMGLCVTS